MPHITFTDSIGAAQLDNGLTAIAAGVGSRFTNWVSESVPVGPSRTSLGTGQRYLFPFRTDYRASFELHEIPNADVTILDRLIAHLLNGGQVSVTTGDTPGSVYATCCLAEGAAPQKRMFDRGNITWSLSVTLVNVAGAPVPMTCLYSS